MDTRISLIAHSAGKPSAPPDARRYSAQSCTSSNVIFGSHSQVAMSVPGLPDVAGWLPGDYLMVVAGAIHLSIDAMPGCLTTGPIWRIRRLPTRTSPFLLLQHFVTETWLVQRHVRLCVFFFRFFITAKMPISPTLLHSCAEAQLPCCNNRDVRRSRKFKTATGHCLHHPSERSSRV